MDNNNEAFLYDENSRDFILKLYNNHRIEMLKLAFSILNDWHEAEDAVEDAFINIAKNYKKIIDSDDYEIKKYLVVTVNNISYNILRRKKREICRDENIVEEYLLNNSAEEIAISEISYDDLKSSLDKLNPRQKQILNMKYMGYSNKEIAKELNVKDGTIRVTLMRIKIFFKNSKEGSLNHEG